MKIRLFDASVKECGCLISDGIFFDNKAGMVLVGDKRKGCIRIFRTIDGQNISHFIDSCLDASVFAKMQDGFTNDGFPIRGRWILKKSVCERYYLRFHII